MSKRIFSRICPQRRRGEGSGTSVDASAAAAAAAQGLNQLILMRALMREFITSVRWKIALMILLMMLVAALEGAGLLMLAPMLELTGVSGNSHSGVSTYFQSIFSVLGLTPSLKAALGIYLVLIVVHTAMSWYVSILTSRLMLSFVDRLRQNLFDRIGASEWNFMARTHSAEFSHVLTVDIYRVQTAISAIIGIFMIGVMTTGYTVAALYLSPALTCMTIGAGAALILLLRRHHGYSYKLGEEITVSTRRVHEDISEFLVGLKLAKSGNVEGRLSARFAENMLQARESTIEFSRRHAFSRGLFRVSGAIVLCAFVYIALIVMAVKIAVVLALAFIFMRLFPYLSQIQQTYELLMHALPAYKAYTDICAGCEREMEPAGDGETYELSREISFNQVAYRPLGGGDDIVTGLNLSIPVRSTTALIGPSGAGKSTTADLLAGLLAPTNGWIAVDDRELKNRRAWRDHVAYVPQETFLFNATVRQNLLWITPEATDEMLWDALDQAAAASFIRALPQGLDTVLGERGIRLSGGERQRLAIARALLRKPLLLVLDEATSALDQDNELHIQETLSRLHRQLTILLIAHRPATVLCADQIVSLQNGRFVKTELRSALQAKSLDYQ